MKKIIVIGVILLFLGSSIPVLAHSETTGQGPLSHTLYVGGSGPGNYSKIQDAINDSMTWDTVFVFHGTYDERVVISKRISLIGEDKNTTIIDAEQKGCVVVLWEDGITVSGFTIQNCSNAWDYAEIAIYTNSNKILNNIILSNIPADPIRNDGIAMYQNNNSIIGNTISNQWDGIFIEGTMYNIIRKNHIFNTIHGIYTNGCGRTLVTENNISNIINNNIYLDYQSHDCVISNNYLDVGTEEILVYRGNNITITGNEIRNAYNQGIDISGNNTIISNNSIHNSDFAITIESGSYPTISNNAIFNSSVGIDYWDGLYGNISYNRVSYCGSGMQIGSPGASNFVFKNEFRGNGLGLYTDVKFGTVKITCNNFINNTTPITFQQTLPIRRQTPGNPIFFKNYYDDWRGIGPKVIRGLDLIFVIIIVPVYLPAFYCDWHPANHPYDIPTGGVQ